MFDTKHQDLSLEIERKIFHGEYSGKMPGIRELSIAYEVSTRTMSKALRALMDKGLIYADGPKGTFTSNYASRKRPRHWVIGVCGLNSLVDSKSPELLTVEDIARKNNCETIILNNVEQIIEKKPLLLSEFSLDGLIFSRSLLNPEAARLLKSSGIPFISCNRTVGIPGVNWVDYNNEKAMATLLKQLVAKGYARIAYISPFNPSYSYTERIHNVYKEILAEAHIYNASYFYVKKSLKDLGVKSSDLNQYACQAAHYLLKLPVSPDLIICHNDMMDGLHKGLGRSKGIKLVAWGATDATDKSKADGFVFLPYLRRVKLATEFLFKMIDSGHALEINELIDNQIEIDNL